jgi:hypothetical protein
MSDIFYQDDDDKRYYCMDFSTHPNISSLDSISGTPTVTSEVRGGFTSDLIIENVTASGLYTCMWISGGSANKTYKIEVIAYTNNGAKVEGDGFVRIGD